MNETQKIVISNNSDKPLTILLEPWGEDYTLRGKESVEIIAENCEPDFYYDVVYEGDYVAVYAEGKGNEYPRVYSNGVELDCGHNRNLNIVGL